MISGLFSDMRRYLPSLIVTAIMGLIAIPIVTRLFSPGDYGNYVLTIATVGVFSTIVGWLSMSIIKFYPAYERDGKLGEFYPNIIKLTAVSILVISLVFLSILLFAKSHISPKLYSLMWVGIAVFILTAIFNVFQDFLRAKREVSWYSGFTIWKSVMTLALGVLLIIAFHFGVEGLLWGSVLSVAVVFPLLWKKAIGKVSVGSKNVSFSLTSEMAKYGFPLVVGNLAAWILSLSDRYILGFFRGSQEVGIYSASYSLSEKSILLIVSLFMLAAGPIGMNIWAREDKKRSREFLHKLTRYYIIFCLPAVIGLSVLSKPIVTVIIAQKYHAGYVILPYIASGVFFLGLQWIFAFSFRYYAKTYIVMLLISISGLVNLALNIILIPTYGYFAAAVTTFVSYVFLLILIIIISRKFFIWEFPFKSLGRTIISSTVMGVSVYYIGNNLTSFLSLNLIIGILGGVFIYSVLLILLGELKGRESQVLLRFIKKEKFFFG